MFCPKCKNKIENNQNYCNNCGYNLSKVNRLVWLIILIVITILGVFAFTGFYMYKKNTLKNIIPSILNCDYYQTYENGGDEQASGYIQCALDKKIKPLNAAYKIKEQEEYWNDIGFIMEHYFDNKIRYRNENPNLIGKYNTMEKLDQAVFKESIVYNMGSIAHGLREYVGPDYMFGHGTWEKYLEVTKSQNSDFGKLSNSEQIKIAKQLQGLTKFVETKFLNDYYKNVYILELVGYEYGATSPQAKKILQNTISIIYNKNENNELNAILGEEGAETPDFTQDIKDYENLAYDKAAIYKAYKEASDHCFAHQSDKDENGNYLNAGSGFIEGCIASMLEEKGGDYLKVSKTFWNYCNAIHNDDGMAEIRTCFIGEFENLSSYTDKMSDSPSDVLSIINQYQTKYWEIVKRHDTLLMTWADDDKERDREELNLLFKEVQGKIDKDNTFFKKYIEIEEQFKENNGNNTIEVNEFASKHYDAVDKLLNDVYKAVRNDLSEKDFEQLKSTQIAWLNEVQGYKEVFDAQGFGTIRTVIAFNYEINMRNFRTLLLMLYL